METNPKENIVEIEYLEVSKNNHENNQNNELKKIIYDHKDGFLIKTKDNIIKYLKQHKDFNSNGDYKILCRIRRSFKNNVYEAINPIINMKIIISEDFIHYLCDKLWYPVKSSKYCRNENNQDYFLNENAIIKFGSKIYYIFKFVKEKSSIINYDNFNNNISNINKKSKLILNIDIKTNQYKINNNKNNEKVNEVNRQQIKCSNENKNEISNGSINESINEDENKSKIMTINENRNGNFIRRKNKAISENENQNEISYESGSRNEIVSTGENRANTENAVCGSESESESENENDKCWLCLNSDSDINNPLICLCNCHNYIHYECLKMYLNTKIIIYENSKKIVTTYRCEKFNCDKCLKPYPLRFRIPEFNKIYKLIDFILPKETDYICLESLDYFKDKGVIKTLHIVQLIDEEITIGRNKNNDIIDYDSSISSEHAILRYNKNNGNLILEDKNGKSETLVLVRGNIKITEEKTFFQIGDTKISMKLKGNKFKKNDIYNDNSHY